MILPDAAAAASRPPHTDAPTDDAVLVWRVHRLREEGGRYVPLIAGGYALAIALWWLVFPHPVALFIPLFLLTGALSEYLFPVEYRLSQRGASVRCGLTVRLFLAWNDVRRASHGSDGVFLSPLSRPSRLDSFRGIRLRYGSDNAEMVRDAVVRLWKGNGAA